MTSKPDPQVNISDPTQRLADSHMNNNGQEDINYPDNVTFTTSRVSNVEAIIRAVETYSQATGKIPKLFDRFPFNRSKLLRRLLLRADEYFFSRQRQTNLLLAQIVREQHKRTNEVCEQMKEDLSRQAFLLTSLQNGFLDQKRVFTALLKQTHDGLPISIDGKWVQSIFEPEDYSLDLLYAAFEDQFRGNREEVKERQRIYLPLVKRSLEETEGEVVDIGCGRGEWLELLREQGLPGRGVDINHFVVKQCHERGLDITENDAVSYLCNTSNESLGAVTGFHIVEHLPFITLIRLLDETVRTLKTGGVAIFETPNPQNVLVGSNNFYFDPTHRNPIPSLTLKFLAEARGLCRVEIMELHPYPESFRVSGSDLAIRFNEYFYGPQDYALIGYKS